MGFFRKHKKSDHSLDECKRECHQILAAMTTETETDKLEELARRWAEFRELQARHEGENASDVN